MTAALWWCGQKASYRANRPVVYRAYDQNGRLIYIGSTHDVCARFGAHELSSWWHVLVADVTTEDYPTVEAARIAESLAIQEEQPAFNVAGTTAGPVLTEADVDVLHEWRKTRRVMPLIFIDLLNERRYGIPRPRQSRPRYQVRAA